ncbi:hypothetical protein Fmac_020875 [Flemingia macrophylla]|uniref:Uncharacterized protein n=1 Tax=Flemingia macrophylla TaxID=520843 RepID=A0ABD1LV83_9FABA
MGPTKEQHILWDGRQHVPCGDTVRGSEKPHSGNGIVWQVVGPSRKWWKEEKLAKKKKKKVDIDNDEDEDDAYKSFYRNHSKEDGRVWGERNMEKMRLTWLRLGDRRHKKGRADAIQIWEEIQNGCFGNSDRNKKGHLMIAFKSILMRELMFWAASPSEIRALLDLYLE